MRADPLKLAAAQAALEFVPAGEVLGIGTGSTVNLFIDALGAAGLRITGAVSSSEASSARLRAHGITVLELNDVLAQGRAVPVYVDGADEIDPGMRMIKGGGGALTREKIIAQAAGRFVCIADASKQVDRLGVFPLPIEVVPMARELVMRRLREAGARPVHRAGFVTDNGNQIIDVRGLDLSDPVAVEAELEQWPGVVTSGLFARRGADVALLGRASGVLRLEPAGL